MKTSKYGGYLELELSGDEVEERRADGLVGIFGESAVSYSLVSIWVEQDTY